MKPLSDRIELDLKILFPFQLDDFQQTALAALAAGKSLVVCAPTGSGKTAIAEYAVYRALARGKRAFYTTPLKALSNQKFRDFQEAVGARFPEAAPQQGELAVGLITGDMVINPGAPLVVMTTEIFRNMLYETPIGQVGTSLENVETVILDECHYISDRGRGTVWEESIIYCPPTIQLVALSATIGNPEELTAWINRVRGGGEVVENKAAAQLTCELVNSDRRPVPLQFFFCNKKGLFPLLNAKQTAPNPRLPKNPPKGRRWKREDCPSPLAVLKKLQERDLLPAIYLIFSRRGCEQAIQGLERMNLVSEEERKTLTYHLLTFFLAGNPERQAELLSACEKENPTLHEKLLDFLAYNPQSKSELLAFLAANPDTRTELFNFLALQSEFIRPEQVEPLLRGIAAHHAGILPAWKELVEQLFELGLVKVVFATATLSAGINMPARTTVLSALSRRTDEGHTLLTPSEFLQMAGRAGRRGMDAVGYVVAVQTPVEGAKEAAYLATAKPEPLRSCFAPSYGMVLNLLQKHSLGEIKDLLEKSFAEYLAQQKLAPEKEAIGAAAAELARLDVQLAGVEERQFVTYEKLKGKCKEGQRLLKILQQQAEESRREAIASQLPSLELGSLLYLKGKHIKVAAPLPAVLVDKVHGSGQIPYFICLGEDNRWYVATTADIAALNSHSLPPTAVAKLNLPTPLNPPSRGDGGLGRWQKGDQLTAEIARQIAATAAPIPVASEVAAQQEKVAQIEAALADHPLGVRENPTRWLKLHHHRLRLREQLHRSQVKYQQVKFRKAYYWEEFLNLIEILRSFGALDRYKPTPLGEAAATIRGENELWLGLVLMSGALDELAPPHLAAAACALITETLRPDSWTNYLPPTAVMKAFRSSGWQGSGPLREVRRQLIQAQSLYAIAIPAWLEVELMGAIEQWALGTDWQELWENVSLDEGDLVRLLRRTIDLLWQIPHIPHLSPSLREKAREAVRLLKRFPV